MSDVLAYEKNDFDRKQPPRNLCNALLFINLFNRNLSNAFTFYSFFFYANQIIYKLRRSVCLKNNS